MHKSPKSLTIFFYRSLSLSTYKKAYVFLCGTRWMEAAFFFFSPINSEKQAKWMMFWPDDKHKMAYISFPSSKALHNPFGGCSLLCCALWSGKQKPAHKRNKGARTKKNLLIWPYLIRCDAAAAFLLLLLLKQ